LTKKLVYIKFRRLEDLVKLVALSLTPIIQHVAINNKHVYFVQSVSLLGRPLIYFFDSDEEIGKKYIIYNKFKDEISFSDKLSTDGQSVSIPVLEVEKTNLLKEIYEET